jgi:hypothetical protein
MEEAKRIRNMTVWEGLGFEDGEGATSQGVWMNGL